MTDNTYAGKKDKNGVSIKVGDTLKLEGDISFEDEDELIEENYLDDSIQSGDFLVNVISSSNKPMAEICDKYGNILETVGLDELDDGKIEIVENT